MKLTHKKLVDKRIEEGLEDIRKGRVYGPFDSVQDLIRSLHSKLKKTYAKSFKATKDFQSSIALQLRFGHYLVTKNREKWG